MALTLVRLRWTLTLNQWRRSPFTLVMSVLGALYVLGMAAVAVTLLVTGLPALPDEARGATTVLAAAVVVLAWLVIPPFVTGVDATLDPHSFVLFPVPARTLIAGLVLSAFTTPVGLATLAVLVGLGASWWDRPAALAAGLAGGALTAVTAVAIGSGLAGLLAAYASRRRVRDVVSVLLFIPLMLGGVALSQAIASFEDFLAIAPQVARGAAWTPFGAGPAAAWAAAEGRGAAVALHLAVAAAWCLAALALWHLAVRRTVEPVAVGGGRSRRVAAGADPTPLRWLGRPATGPRTAIAARAQRYWLADPRYAAGSSSSRSWPSCCGSPGAWPGRGVPDWACCWSSGRSPPGPWPTRSPRTSPTTTRRSTCTSSRACGAWTTAGAGSWAWRAGACR
ncbi:hypothetical protein M3D04_002710 [Micrococcus luteus]|nr:hypothetical protein [Micrococcus luteus]